MSEEEIKDKSSTDSPPALRKVSALDKTFGQFELYCDEEDMLAYVGCLEPSPSIERQGLIEVLNEFELDELIEGNVDELLMCLQAGEVPEKLLLARGTEVEDGEDARIDYFKRPSGMKQSIDKDAEKVDYREINALVNVCPGEVIGVYVPPIEGRGGSDVFGRVVPARKVKDVIIHAGENVEFNTPTGEYRATSDGHVELRGDKLSVSESFRVRGSVDLAIGNIRFVGKVIVEKDVPDEFVVEADRGIRIGGTAEACELKSKEDIIIKGGVTGKNKGLIDAGGRVAAHFLNEANVIALGDVVIRKEIVNSKVFTMGRVVVDGGTVVGSEIVALKGICVHNAGSELGVKTTMIAGLDYRVREKIMSINNELIRCETQQDGMLQRVGPMLAKVARSSMADSREADMIDEMMPEIRRVQRRIVKLRNDSDALSSSFEDQAINAITVEGKLHSGVTIVAGKIEKEYIEALDGPITFMPDEDAPFMATSHSVTVEDLWEQRGMAPLREKEKKS